MISISISVNATIGILLKLYIWNKNAFVAFNSSKLGPNINPNVIILWNLTQYKTKFGLL